MAILDFTDLTITFDMTDEGSADFAAFVGSSTSSYDWITSNGQFILGDSSTFLLTDGFGLPISGTFYRFDLGDITIEDVSVDATLLDYTASQFATDTFWSSSVNGDDTFIFDDDFELTIYGDLNDLNSGVLIAGDDIFNGDGSYGTEVTGDVHTVDGGTLIAGDDTFNGSGQRLFGDVTNQNGGTVFGGNDTIIYSNNWNSVDFFAGFGDADEIFDAVMVGGDDIIDASASTNVAAGEIALGWLVTGAGIIGDVSVLTNSYVSGGDDTLAGTQSDDIVIGDAVEVDASSTLEAGNDTINGEDGDDLLLGDVFVSAGTTTFGNDTILGGDGGDAIYGDFFDNINATDGGDDILDGGEGDDFIFGNGGNDLIIGGIGNDELDGGAGNDRIIFDAEDTAANVTGGADVDTLVVIGGELPLSYDLVAGSFELVEHQLTDSGSEFWSTIFDTYNDAWQQVTQDGVADNGNTWHTDFDVAGTQWWASVTQWSNSDGQITNTDFLADDGSIVGTVYDFNEDQWYEFYSNYFDINDALTNQDGVADDGRYWSASYDTSAGGTAEWWSSYTLWYDEQNPDTRQLINEEGVADDGRTWTTSYDVDDVYVWTSQTNWFDSSGDLIETITV